MPRDASGQLVGCEEPRLWSRPLRELTPETSLGFECIAFATVVLGVTLDPWQKWFLIHALELKPDGSFRFRTILLLVARQNGKTTVMRVLSLWAIFTGRVRLVVGTAQDLDVARESWAGAVDLVLDDVELAAEVEGGRPRRTNGQEELKLTNGCRYKIKATTENAGRGIPGVGLLLLDELRTHRDTKAWSALSKTTLAVPNALIVGMSNAGDDSSVVLNQLRDKALAGADPTLGIFEYSAPDGCALDDRDGWCQANPSLGNGRLSEVALLSALSTDTAAVFRTECLCQRVETLDSAVDFNAWRGGEDPAGSLAGRDDLVAAVDVGMDGLHVSVVVAGRESGGRVRVQVAGAWGDTQTARAELPALLDRIGARRVVWFPAGPGAVFAPLMEKRRRAVEIRGTDLSAACMGFADLVRSGMVLHNGDPLLDAHVGGACRINTGDGWRFGRRNSVNCDAAIAAAGAVHVLLTKMRRQWEPPGQPDSA